MHYNGANSYLFVNGAEIIKFKAKDSETVAYSLYLGNISKDWTNDNMKETGFNGYIYDFSSDYNAIAVSDILDIHKYFFSVKINKCSGNCNNINDPYAKTCVPDTVKKLNVKVFNLMSRTNETRHIKWHETCKCICILDKLFVAANKDGMMINVDVIV